MATVPSEVTAVAGTVLTAATWNSNVRDAVNFLIARPLFIGYQTVAQSVANSTWASLLLDTEEIDRDNGHSTTSNTSRYTVQTAGWYDIQAASAWATNATGQRGGRITVNGNAKPGRASYVPAVSNGYITAVPTVGRAYGNIGDYIEIQGAQGSGGALNTGIASDFACYLSCLWTST